MEKPMSEKYEPGGQVQISGKWWPISTHHHDASILYVQLEPRSINLEILREVITDYRPPVKEQKPFEWLTKSDLNKFFVVPIEEERKDINTLLTERYGDPTERKYNGEPAEEFGLTGGAIVLYLDEDGDWAPSCFSNLEKGDIWRKPPPVLQNWWYHQF